MDERIKELRKSLGLTQAEFGERVALKQNTVASYESGRTLPSDAVILSICREFHASAEWLRTGQGEMFVKMDMADEISKIFGLTFTDDSPLSRCKRTVMHAMLQAGPEFWDVFLDIAEKLANEKEEQDP